MEEIELLHISNDIANIYRQFIRGKRNARKTDIEKCLTRNFILGTVNEKRSNDKVQVRKYGNLSIMVDMNSLDVLSIYNKKGGNESYINIREKEALNKILGIGSDEMNNKILYQVVGASGSGKDYIVDKICEEFNKKKVISRTTRKSRYKGENTHLFVSEKMADTEFGTAVAKTNFNGYRYYTTYDDIDNKDFYIIDPAGVESMKKQNKLKTTSVFIKTPWYIRAWHMKKRGDGLKNILSRLRNDKVEFKNFTGDLNFKSSKRMYNYFAEEYRNEEI
ncbi:MAG: hypothetical protein RR942_06525 [Romboutsia sp.]